MTLLKNSFIGSEYEPYCHYSGTPRMTSVAAESLWPVATWPRATQTGGFTIILYGPFSFALVLNAVLALGDLGPFPEKEQLLLGLVVTLTT